jgi:hypothetical protein
MHHKFSPKYIIKFWSKADRSEQSAQCWLWLGTKNESGYGYLRMGGRYTRHWYAHRVAWILTNGEIPDGLCVLHHCDMPACVRPDHLFLGTRKDNALDRIAKHRRVNEVLSDAEVREIRALRGIESQRKIANRLGVSKSTVGYAQRGMSYRHVDS